jgi:hypothetical protein
MEKMNVYIHLLLTSVLVGGELSPSRPGRFTPEERASPRFPLDWRLTGLDAVDNSDPSAVQTVAGRYTDCSITDFNLNPLQ